MTMPDQAGWYDDPDDANAQRYWDGQSWTPHRQRKPASRPGRAPAMSTPPQSPGPLPTVPAAPAAAPTQLPPAPTLPPPPSQPTMPAPGFSGGYQPPTQPPAQAAQQPAPGAPIPAGQPGAQFNAGEAFSWAWAKFTANAGPFIVSILAYVVVFFVVFLAIWMLGFTALIGGAASSVDTTSTYDSYSSYQHSSSGYDQSSDGSAGAGLGFMASLLIVFVGYFVVLLLQGYFAASFLSGTLDVADGKPVTIGSFFKPRNFGSVIITAIAIGLLAAVGMVFCVLPGLIFLFLAQFSFLFVIDRRLSPIEGIKASIALNRARLGETLTAYLVCFGIWFVGGLAFYIGQLVAAPVAMLVNVYAYRVLSGGQVAALPPRPPAPYQPQPPY